MQLLKISLIAGLLTASALSTPTFAETVLRLDEVAVGELDPGKASDYADSILMFNSYDKSTAACEARRRYTKWPMTGGADRL